MSTPYTLADIGDEVEAWTLDRLSGVPRLVLKALIVQRRINEGIKSEGPAYYRTKRYAEAVAERSAYAGVAADVFNLCHAPQKFIDTIDLAEARYNEILPRGADSREATGRKRAAWVKAVMDCVQANLGTDIALYETQEV